MLTHPNFDPVALQLGPISIHWYGLMYLVGFATVWLLGRYRIAKGDNTVNTKTFEDLIFFCVLGVVIGGRLGYILFYKPGVYRSEEHTSELQSRGHIVCRLLLEKKKKNR